jgi:hypothetical protein
MMRGTVSSRSDAQLSEAEEGAAGTEAIVAAAGGKRLGLIVASNGFTF